MREKKIRLPECSHYETVEKTRELLMKSNREWIGVCKGYADSIWKNNDRYEESGKEIRKLLNRISKKTGLPLSLYSRVSFAKDCSATDYYDIRVYGRSVATALVNNGIVTFKTDDKSVIINKNSREQYKTSLQEVVELFNNCDAKEIDNEHCLENFILEEFARKRSDKALPYIQPVKFGEGFVQMRTPLKASNHNIVYSSKSIPQLSGGGIDILARANHGSSRHQHFVVIELKDDENNYNESQPLVMQQALMYATFLACLFRTEEAGGTKWYNIFRNTNKGKWREVPVPSTLKIDVVTMMPPIDYEEKISNWLSNKSIPVFENTTLELHTCYVDKKDTITFSGSFPESLKKVVKKQS